MVSALMDPDNVQFELEDDADVDESTSEHTGAMIALVPTEYDAEQLALDNGELVSDLHTTLFYLGEAEEMPSDTYDRVVDYCTRIAADYALMEGNAFGVALWNLNSEPSIVLNIGGCDCFESIHNEIESELATVLGVEIPEQHSPWVPHICLAYSDDPELFEEAKTRVGALEFDRIRVAFAGEYVDIPLTGE